MLINYRSRLILQFRETKTTKFWSRDQDFGLKDYIFHG